MCDPITIASMAVAAGGGLLTAHEQHQTQSDMIQARNAATREELARQQAFRQQSQGQFRDQMDEFKPQEQAEKLDTEQGSVAKAFRSNAPTKEAVGSIGSASAPRVVKESEGKKVADAFAFGNKQNNALGDLAGWDQRFFANNLGLNQTGRELDITSDFARTSAAVNGLEQDAAYRNAYSPPSGIGDLMQFAGSVGAYGGQKGWFNAPMFKSMAPTGMGTIWKPGAPVYR